MKMKGMAFGIVILLCGSAQAADPIADLVTVKSGAIVCAATGNTQINVRNIDPVLKLVLNNMKIYDNRGTIIYNTATDSWPVGFENILRPKQSSNFDTNDILVSPNGPLQVRFTFVNRMPGTNAITLGLAPMIGGSIKHKNDQGTVIGFHTTGCKFESVVTQ